MQTRDQPALGWTVVLRRQPARIVAGRAEGGYADVFELICCDCGDHPDLDYREVSADLQRIRGPYPIAVGITAYGKHLELLHSRPARMRARCPPTTEPAGATVLTPNATTRAGPITPWASPRPS